MWPFISSVSSGCLFHLIPHVTAAVQPAAPSFPIPSPLLQLSLEPPPKGTWGSNYWETAIEPLQHTHAHTPTSPPRSLAAYTSTSSTPKPSWSFVVSRLCCSISFYSTANQRHISPTTTCGRKEWQRRGDVCVRARAPASTCIRATKPRTKLRVAPRSPPEAESRLSSLFSGSGVPAVRGERWRATLSALWLLQFRRPLGNETQNIAKDKDLNCRTPIWTDGYFFFFFFSRLFPSNSERWLSFCVFWTQEHTVHFFMCPSCFVI